MLGSTGPFITASGLKSLCPTLSAPIQSQFNQTKQAITSNPCLQAKSWLHTGHRINPLIRLLLSNHLSPVRSFHVQFHFHLTATVYISTPSNYSLYLAQATALRSPPISYASSPIVSLSLPLLPLSHTDSSPTEREGRALGGW